MFRFYTFFFCVLLIEACQSLLPSLTDGGDQAFRVGECSLANKVEAIGQSLQTVLTSE